MSELTKFANNVYNTYRFDIACPISTYDFYKEKFKNDEKNRKKICQSIYKKLK